MIKAYHYKSLTEDERRRLNGPNGGWDSEPRFTRYADVTLSGNTGAAREAWALGEYAPVAEVSTYDLDDAFSLTNHITSDWTENDGVKALADSVRSTSVGDIFEKGGGFYLVAPFGFTRLDGLDA